MFGRNFKKLIQSTKYKESKYVIHKLNGKYALYNTNIQQYLDLDSCNIHWELGDRFFNECLGSKSRVITVFNYLHPEIITFKQY